MPRASRLEKDLFDPPPGAIIAGIDEAGRGPLAGPVFAAAVIISAARVPEGVADSKQLTEEAREELFPLIMNAAVAVGVGQASVKEIDKLNIHHATLLAMKRAFKGLSAPCDFVYVDGVYLPRIRCQGRAVIDGDALLPMVSAASIVAKVSRDRLMRKLDEKFPGYGWAQNKGYSTPDHFVGLKALGPTKHHRTSFEPVRLALAARGPAVDALVPTTTTVTSVALLGNPITDSVENPRPDREPVETHRSSDQETQDRLHP
jgi:ribonuclease HII